MKTDNLTTDQKELMLELMLAKACDSSTQTINSPNETAAHKLVGKLVCVASCVSYFTGRLVAIDGTFLTLSEAAWVPDTGRMNEFFADPTKAKEIEPLFCNQIIPLMSIVFMTEIPKLPGGVK